ncbi:MAG: cytochrome c biogenesis protein CcsA [Parabacteroides sp.]|nr:cytochrome c biogenesis protein CcsA [Parabacteroides sp.]
MGETRLWYSFFLPVAGLITYVRWRYKWILSFSTLLAGVFICINLLKPEIHNKTLMPALQSPWFAPHVIVYMFAYAMLGAAAIFALTCCSTGKGSRSTPTGWPFATTWSTSAPLSWPSACSSGLSGRKKLGGHYWSWDPKETWAAATWLANLLYIHFRLNRQAHHRAALGLLLFSFILLQVCWFGVNYLPSAQGKKRAYL